MLMVFVALPVYTVAESIEVHAPPGYEMVVESTVEAPVATIETMTVFEYTMLYDYAELSANPEFLIPITYSNKINVNHTTYHKGSTITTYRALIHKPPQLE